MNYEVLNKEGKKVESFESKAEAWKLANANEGYTVVNAGMKPAKSVADVSGDEQSEPEESKPVRGRRSK